jgi:hypothetical protein
VHGALATGAPWPGPVPAFAGTTFVSGPTLVISGTLSLQSVFINSS